MASYWLAREMVVVVWGAAPLPCPPSGVCGPLVRCLQCGTAPSETNVAWPRCQGWSSCQPDLTSPLTPRLGTRAAPTARATSAAPCVPRESARQAWRGPSWRPRGPIKERRTSGVLTSPPPLPGAAEVASAPEVSRDMYKNFSKKVSTQLLPFRQATSDTNLLLMLSRKQEFPVTAESHHVTCARSN